MNASSNSTPLNNSDTSANPITSRPNTPEEDASMQKLLGQAIKPLPKTEEENKSDTPLPFLPLSHTLDTIEQLPPASYNHDHLPKLIPPIFTKNEQSNLDEYAQYMGRGGTIYVHVLYADATVYSKVDGNGGIQRKLTKQHFEDAAAISNERFKKLDINLKVVVVFDTNAIPLTRQEFQERKPDPANRRAMPEGFEQEYNPMDSYVVVDIAKRSNDLHKGDYKGIVSLLEQSGKSEHPNNWEFEDPSTETDFLDKTAKMNWGRSSALEFIALLTLRNENEKQSVVQGMYDIFRKDFAVELDDVEGMIVQMLAASIEHETLHPKLVQYSENVGHGKPNYIFAKDESGMYKTPTDYFLKTPPSRRDNNESLENTRHFYSRRNNPRVVAGHREGTLMAEEPHTRDFNNADLGCDPYIVTLLQTIHGKQGQNKPTDPAEFTRALENLEKERLLLLGEILEYQQMVVPLAYEKLTIDENGGYLTEFVKETELKHIANIKRFEIIEFQMEAYIDALRMLSGRRDFQIFLSSERRKAIDSHIKNTENGSINKIWRNTQKAINTNKN